MKHSIYTGIILIAILAVSCDHWDDTAGVSHVTYLPEFEFTGGDFISVLAVDSGKMADPGCRVTVEGKPVNYFSNFNSIVDITNPGVYIASYYAENTEGFSKTAERIVAVTYEDISENDLSGTYSINVFGPAETRVTRINGKGLYKIDDILGYPGALMPGRFVDIGENKLVLLPGEGYFGNYDASEGSYTKSLLSWSVILLDPPNTGVEVPVTWHKID